MPKSSGKESVASPARTYDIRYKVLVLGDAGVGKTALLKSLTGQEFSTNMLATVGVDFVTRQFTVDGVTVELQIWDTAGQERFRSITKFQYRGTKGLLLVYDVTDVDTFNTLDYWLNSIDTELDGPSREPVPVVLLGNKTDLVGQRAVSAQQGRKVGERAFVYAFFETSAQTGVNVELAGQTLAKAMLEIYDPKLISAYWSPEEKKKKEEEERRLKVEEDAKTVKKSRTFRIKLHKKEKTKGKNKKEKKLKCTIL